MGKDAGFQPSKDSHSLRPLTWLRDEGEDSRKSVCLSSVLLFHSETCRQTNAKMIYFNMIDVQEEFTRADPHLKKNNKLEVFFFFFTFIWVLAGVS